MTKRQAKKHAYWLAWLRLQSDVDSGADLHCEEKDWLKVDAAMDQVIQSLFERAKRFEAHEVQAIAKETK